jgi:hypothetical protein
MNYEVEPASLLAGDKNDNCRDRTKVEWISLENPPLAEQTPQRSSYEGQ